MGIKITSAAYDAIQFSGEGQLVSKTKTYTGASGLGAVGAAVLFTVTGDVEVCVFAKCTSDLTEGGATATIEVGISGNTAAIIAADNAVDINDGAIWLDASPATVEAKPSYFILVGGTDIQELIGGAQTVDGGTLTYYCWWRPLSSDGNVVAA